MENRIILKNKWNLHESASFSKIVNNLTIQHTYIKKLYIILNYMKQGIKWSQQIGHMTQYVPMGSLTKSLSLLNTMRKHINKASTVIEQKIGFFYCSYCSLGQVEWYSSETFFNFVEVDSLCLVDSFFVFPKKGSFYKENPSFQRASLLTKRRLVANQST